MNAIPDALPPSARDDQIQPFLLESSGIRGRLLRLGDLGNTIVLRHDYPSPLARLLAEMLALSGALSSLLKYEGVFTAQAKGDGPVSLLVADVTAEGNLRGYASFDEDRLGELLNRDEAPSFQEIMGKGYFAYTVDLGSTQERYQGIVELKGARLSDCLQHYFLQSDQVQSGIVLSADLIGNQWRAGALILQRIPEEGGVEQPISNIDDEDAWRRAMTLQVSCTPEELLDPALSAHDLLFRLFHEEGVRVFQPRSLTGNCRCSRERVSNVLNSIPYEHLEELKVEGVISATCEFCNEIYQFLDGDF